MKKPKSLILKKILEAKAAGTFDPDAQPGPNDCKMVHCGGKRETKEGYCMECDWSLVTATRRMIGLDA